MVTVTAVDPLPEDWLTVSQPESDAMVHAQDPDAAVTLSVTGPPLASTTIEVGEAEAHKLTTCVNVPTLA
jgi:hypothetical protein